MIRVIPMLSLLLATAVFGQALPCPAPIQSSFVPGATVALLSNATNPPTLLNIFVFHSDCSITGVGNPNISGSWGFQGTGTANMQVSINTATSSNGVLQSLSNMTIGFYMVSSTNVGNFEFPAIVQTTLNATTGMVTKQSLNPFSPDGSNSAFQLVAWPGGFNAGMLATIPKVKAGKAPAKK